MNTALKVTAALSALVALFATLTAVSNHSMPELCSSTHDHYCHAYTRSIGK